MTVSKEFLRGVIVVDIEDSPLWRAAQYHCNLESIKIISAISFSSPIALTRAIAKNNPAYVIFSWREAFDAVLFDKQSREILSQQNPLIFLLIPDHLGLDLYKESEVLRCSMADVVLTTSMKLQEAYMELIPGLQTEVLHDIPDLSRLRETKSRMFARNRSQVIWIGNSQWGKRQGVKDHKGLNRFAYGIIEVVRKQISDANLIIIDSAQRSLRHGEVLEKLAQSSCLVVTSNSEGTCLPILEATALGTPVVTFDVGIANEIFTGNLCKEFIASRDIDEAANLVSKVLLNFDQASECSLVAWESYFHNVSCDITRIIDRNFLPLGKWRVSKGHRVSYLKWYLRWLRSLVSKLRN